MLEGKTIFFWGARARGVGKRSSRACGRSRGSFFAVFAFAREIAFAPSGEIEVTVKICKVKRSGTHDVVVLLQEGSDVPTTVQVHFGSGVCALLGSSVPTEVSKSRLSELFRRGLGFGQG